MNGLRLVAKSLSLAAGALYVVERVLWYRTAVRDGTARRDSRFARAGWFALAAVVLMVAAWVLLPMRIEREWPQWLFYPLFALMIVGALFIWRAAFLFRRADRALHDPLVLTTRRSPNEEL